MTSFRGHARGAWAIAAIAGATSVGNMVIVNFLIHSDFKWQLLALGLLWAFALGVHRIEGAPERRSSHP